MSHGVEVAGTSVDEFFNEFREIGSSGPFRRKIANLLFRGHLASTTLFPIKAIYSIGQEKPEETFRKRLLTTRGLWEFFLTFGDSSTTESDSLFGIKN